MLVRDTYTVNWNGNNGIHKFEHSFELEKDYPADDDLFWEHNQFNLIWDWDEIHAYDTDTTTYTRIDNLNVWDGLASPSIDSVVGVGGLVTVTFTAGTGRTPGTKHKVTLADWTGSPSINNKYLATFTSSTVCTFAQQGATSSYTGGSLTSVDIKYADFDDHHSPIFYSDDHEVKFESGFFVSDQESISRGKSLFSTDGRCAVIMRGVTSGGKPWSNGKDFSWGLYIEKLSPFTETHGRQQLFIKSSRQSTPITGPQGPLGNPLRILNFTSIWRPIRPSVMKAGTYARIAYMLTGTFAEVQASIAALDAETDAALGWRRKSGH
jgi:hypothetical protein